MVRKEIRKYILKERKIEADFVIQFELFSSFPLCGSISECSHPFWYSHHGYFCFSYLRTDLFEFYFSHEIHFSYLAYFWKAWEHMRGIKIFLPIFTPNWESHLVQMGPPRSFSNLRVAVFFLKSCQEPLNSWKHENMNKETNKAPRDFFITLSIQWISELSDWVKAFLFLTGCLKSYSVMSLQA